MSSSPPAAAPPSRIANIAFWVWVVGGAAWVVASSYLWDYLWTHHRVTFQYVGNDPVLIARQADGDRMRALLQFSDWAVFAYGLTGAVVFRRRGWGVIAVAGAIVLASWLVGTNL